MLIRCEKCNTLYELDENLLPPNGAPVQCSKCQFVFKAYPARDDPGPASANDQAKGERPGASDAPAPVAPVSGANGTPPPVNEMPVVEPPGATGSAGSERGAGAPAAEPVAAAKGQAQATKRPGPPATSAPGPEEPQFTADGRPIRKVPFPTEEPAPVGPRPVLGRVPGRPAISSRQRMWALVVVPVAVALLLAAAFVAWRMLGRRSDPSHRRADGHSLLLPDGARGPARVAAPRFWTPAAAPHRGQRT